MNYRKHPHIEMPKYMDLQKKVPNYAELVREHQRFSGITKQPFEIEGCFPGWQVPELQSQGNGSYMMVFSGLVIALIKPIKGSSRYFVAIYTPMAGGPFQYLASSKEAAKNLTEAKEIAIELNDDQMDRLKNNAMPKIPNGKKAPTIEQATAILSNYIFGLNGIHGMGTIYLPNKEPYIEIQVLDSEGFDFVKNLIPTKRFMGFPIQTEITPQTSIQPSTSYIGGRSASAEAEGRRTQRMTLTGFALIGITIILAVKW